MYFSKLNLVCIFSFLLPSLLLALDGNSSSGGGECIEYEENPWFVGLEPVSYCIKKDPSFSLSEEEASVAIKKALASWTSTINHLHPRPITSDLLGGHRHNLSTQFVETACSDATELTFLLGGKTPIVDSALKEMARVTIAFAKQVSFNEKTGRAKGFIWVTSDSASEPLRQKYGAEKNVWSRFNNFYNVVLHELGHTFGVLHQPSGIMSSDAPSTIVSFMDLPKFSPHLYVLQRWTALKENTPRVCGSIYYQVGAMKPFFSHNEGASPGVAGCLSQIPGTSNEVNLTFWNVGLDDTGKTFSIKLSGSDEAHSGPAINGNYLVNSLVRTESHTFISDESKILHGFVTTNGDKLAITIESIGRKIRIRYFDTPKEISGHFDLMIPEIEEPVLNIPGPVPPLDYETVFKALYKK